MIYRAKRTAAERRARTRVKRVALPRVRDILAVKMRRRGIIDADPSHRVLAALASIKEFVDLYEDPLWKKGEGGKFTGSDPRGGSEKTSTKSPEAKLVARATANRYKSTGPYDPKKATPENHPGKGYSDSAYLDANGVIRTTDVNDAVRALYEDRNVELNQPREVATLIHQLARVARRMEYITKKRGKEALEYNLCRVSVGGTNLFCTDSKDKTRIEMPQLSGVPDKGSIADKDDKKYPKNAKGEVDLTHHFREHLEKVGYKITDEREGVAQLRATQTQLDGKKVAGIMGAIHNNTLDEARLFVSKDNYILDGHHRWAATVGVDYTDNKGGKLSMPVARVDIGIIELLDVAITYTTNMGIPPRGMGDKKVMKDADFEDVYEDPDYIKGEGGLMMGSRPKGANPETMAVGGGEWNRKTAERLEKEYVAVHPKLDELVKDAVEGRRVVTERLSMMDWSDLPSSTQHAVEEAYMEQGLQYELEQQQQNWVSEEAPDMARYDVAKNFMAGSDREWAEMAIHDYVQAQKDRGEKDLSFTEEQLLNAVTVEHGMGRYPNDKGTIIDFDNAKLNEPEGYDPSPTLPGIEVQEPAAYLKPVDRENLIARLRGAFSMAAEDKVSSMDYPDYLEDQAKEALAEFWADNMSYGQKVEWGKQNTDYLKEAEQSLSGPLIEPDNYDPLEQGDDADDYRKTQRVARYLSQERTFQIMQERGLVDADPAYSVQMKKDIAAMDTEMWEDWKRSSTSNSGQLLQYATSVEMGTRLREKSIVNSKKAIQDMAIEDGADKLYPGGFEGVKAYIRAKWETTQYLLDKAGVHEAVVYRGIDPGKAADDTLAFAPAKIVQGQSGDSMQYHHIPDVYIERNGAASTSTDHMIANGWNGQNRVVLRIATPRTGVLSVPAYGVNIQSEHEVVVIGSGWKGWDAWRHRAPLVDSVPMPGVASPPKMARFSMTPEEAYKKANPGA